MEDAKNGPPENATANFKNKSHNENNGCITDDSNQLIAAVSPETHQDAASLATLARNCSDVPSCNMHNTAKPKHIKKKPMFLHPSNDQMICDDIAATTEDIKRLRHVQARSNSTGKLYQSSRRVSFPENDSELVTGYLEPADPWACG